MENNDNPLEAFKNTLTEYCKNSLRKTSCMPAAFRKHYVSNLGDPEFSLALNGQKSCESNVIDQELIKLITASEVWSLALDSAVIANNKVILKLNRVHAFNRVLELVERQKSNFGRNPSINQIISVTNDVPDQASDLTELRTQVLTKVISNLLEHVGYKVTDSGSKNLHLSKGGNYVSGPVVNKETGKKEKDITPDEYYDLRAADMKLMSEHKTWEKHDQGEMVAQLAAAAVTIDLIRVAPQQAVSFLFTPGADGTAERQFGGRGATFFLYNRARLATLRARFEEEVKTGKYGDINTDIQTGDVNLLTENEEWGLLFNYLLGYPSALEFAADVKHPGPQILCNFMENMVSLFSVYYRRVRVLQEPRKHLVPVMIARLRLLAAVEQVMNNILDIFDLPKLDYM